MELSTDILRTFISVSEEKSFSSAAERLHKSQSSVSTQIKLLEEQLGQKLFHRSKHPPELTEAGSTVYQYATEVIDRTVDLQRDLQALSLGVSGEVRVGAISSINTYFLLPIVGQLLRKHPRLKVSIHTQSRSLLFESVRQGKVDFAIVISDREPDKLSVKVLLRERLCFVTSTKGASKAALRVNVSDLAKTPFVMGLKGSEYTQMVYRVLGKAGIKDVNVAMRISNWEGIKEAVRSRIGIAVLPHFIVERELRNHSIGEIVVRNVRLEADIMLLERLKQQAPSATVSLVKNALVAGIVH